MSFCTVTSSVTAVLGAVLPTCGSGLSGCTVVVPGCVSNSAACTLSVANPTTPNTPRKRIGAVTQRFLALYVLNRFFTSVCCFMNHSPRKLSFFIPNSFSLQTTISSTWGTYTHHPFSSFLFDNCFPLCYKISNLTYFFHFSFQKLPIPQ